MQELNVSIQGRTVDRMERMRAITGLQSPALVVGAALATYELLVNHVHKDGFEVHIVDPATGESQKRINLDLPPDWKGPQVASSGTHLPGWVLGTFWFLVVAGVANVVMAIWNGVEILSRAIQGP